MEEAPVSLPPLNPATGPADASRPRTPAAPPTPPTSDQGRRPALLPPPDVTVSGINLRELANLQSSPLLEPPSAAPARPDPKPSRLRLIKAQPSAAMPTTPAPGAPPPPVLPAPRPPTVQLSRLPAPPAGRTSSPEAASPLSSARSLSEGSALSMADAASLSASPIDPDVGPPGPVAELSFSPSQSRPPTPPPRLGLTPPPAPRGVSLTWPPRAAQVPP